MDDPTTTATEGFGLMFYNARWYDPALGRFAQADSIVPGGVQGLDRYAYVRNSPLNYTDPSGHYECNGDICRGKPKTPPPTPLNPDHLSKDPHNNTGVSAADVYAHYMKLWKNKAGWWWKAYGGDDDGFSFWDYISLYAYNESEYHTEYAATMAEAAVRLYYTRVHQGNNTGDIYGFIDWWAGFSESAAPDVVAQKAPIPQREISAYGAFSIFGVLVSKPPTSGATGNWTTGKEQDRPYGWGNASVYAEYSPTAVEMLKNNALNTSVIPIYIPGDDPFYVPTYCAVANWVDYPGTNPDICN